MEPRRAALLGFAGALILIVVFVFILSLGGACTIDLTPSLRCEPPSPIPTSTQTPSVNITSVADGDEVYAIESVRGTHANIPEGYGFWLVAQPAGEAEYFPDTCGTIKNADGTWNGTAFFGDTQNTGDFTLTVYLLPPDALREFKDRVSDLLGTRNLACPATPIHMLSLPPNVEAQHTVSVRRR